MIYCYSCNKSFYVQWYRLQLCYGISYLIWLRLCPIIFLLIMITSYLIWLDSLLKFHLIRNRPVKIWPCFMVTEKRAFFTLFQLHSFWYCLVWMIILIESLIINRVLIKIEFWTRRLIDQRPSKPFTTLRKIGFWTNEICTC